MARLASIARRCEASFRILALWRAFLAFLLDRLAGWLISLSCFVLLR